MSQDKIEYVKGDSLHLPEGEYCSVKEAAKQIGLSRPTVVSRIRSGIIKGYWMNGLGWIVNLASAQDNSDTLRAGRKPTEEFTA